MNDQLETIVRALAIEDGREVGSKGHRAARARLLQEMEQAGLEDYSGVGFEQPYICGGIDFTNLLGVLPGSRRDLDPVLLAAHYDTCGPYPGADDNAAAIAILLAMVETLRQAALERSVIFAFFDAEEPPHFLTESMGSNWWYRNQRQEKTHCALVLDLVGHDVSISGFEDLLFVSGMESDPGLEPVFRRASEAAALRPLPTLTRYIGDMSDYRAFRLDQRPYLFFTCGQWEHYHMPTDTPEKLNYAKMAATASYLCDITEAVASVDLHGPFEGYDTTPTEIEYFQKTAGPLLEQFGSSPETRADMDLLAQQLVSSFGLLL